MVCNLVDDATIWKIPRQAFEALRWDVNYYNPAIVSILLKVKSQSSNALSPKYGVVKPLPSVQKSYKSKIAKRALSVRDVESGFIYPHIPRLIDPPSKNNYVTKNSVIVTRAGIQGIAAPVIDSHDFWESMGSTYSLSDDGEGIATTSDLFKIEIDDELSAEAISAYISSPVGRSITQRLVYGTSNRHLRTVDLAAIPIPDNLMDLNNTIKTQADAFYDAYAKHNSLSKSIFNKSPEIINAARTIMEKDVICAKPDPYRFDYSWYQFKEIKPMLLRAGYTELGGYIERVRSGGNVTKSESGVLVLGTRDLKPNVLLPRGEKPRMVEQIRESNWANEGEIMVAEVGGGISVGTAALVPPDTSHWRNLGFSVRRGGVAVSNDIIIVSLKDRKDAGFITSFLTSPLGRLQIQALSFTTKQTRMRRYELGKILIPQPESQNEFIKTLYKMNDSILRLRHTIDIEIPNSLGLNPEMMMATARGYMRGIDHTQTRLMDDYLKN